MNMEGTNFLNSLPCAVDYLMVYYVQCVPDSSCSLCQQNIQFMTIEDSPSVDSIVYRKGAGQSVRERHRYAVNPN